MDVAHKSHKHGTTAAVAEVMGEYQTYRRYPDVFTDMTRETNVIQHRVKP